MASSPITSRLGIYTDQDFLDRSTCETLSAEMRATNHEEASVYDKEWKSVVKHTHRRTCKVNVSAELSKMVKEKLMQSLPVLEQRFGVRLTECQGPSFLIYRPGDFFDPHQDYSPSSEAPDLIKQRMISVVVFLNDEGGGDAGEFTGGSLAFYGLLKDPRCQQIGIPVKASTGLLVAFRSDVFHGVSPVIAGERLSIVGWFY